MGSHRAKGLLESIVGAWQINDIVALEESRSITGCDFQKMSNSLTERTGGIHCDLPLRQNHLVALTECRSIEVLLIREQMSCLMHMLIGVLNGGPESSRLVQSLCQESLQALERDREPLFCSTRLSESEMNVSRSCKSKPEASRGARPSSVTAARTARQ